MYNSFIVTLLSRLWAGIENAYRYSLLARIGKKLKSLNTYLFTHSLFRNLFTREINSLEDTLLYRIYSGLIDFLNRIFKAVNDYFKKIEPTSVFYKNINSLLDRDVDIIKSIALFLGAFLIGANLVNINLSGFSKMNFIIFIVTIVGLLPIMLKGEALYQYGKDSGLINWIISLFSLDREGGDQWW